MSRQVNHWRLSNSRATSTGIYATISLLCSIMWAAIYPTVPVGYGVVPAALTALWVILSAVALVEALLYKARLHRPSS